MRLRKPMLMRSGAAAKTGVATACAAQKTMAGLFSASKCGQTLWLAPEVT